MALYHLCTDTNHNQANKSSKGMKLLMQTLSHVTLETFIVLMLEVNYPPASIDTFLNQETFTVDLWFLINCSIYSLLSHFPEKCPSGSRLWDVGCCWVTYRRSPHVFLPCPIPCRARCSPSLCWVPLKLSSKDEVPHYNSFISLIFRAASEGSAALMKFSILTGFEFTCFSPCLSWKKMMNKRLKLEVSQSFKSSAVSVYYGNKHESNTACMHTKKISSEHQTGSKQRAVLFDVTLMGCREGVGLQDAPVQRQIPPAPLTRPGEEVPIDIDLQTMRNFVLK